jgi:histidine triad (HIT) family protein
MMSKGCIFCDIIDGISPADFIFKDDNLVAFKDIRPMAPVHVLIVPRKHIRGINDLGPDDDDLISRMIFSGKDIAKLSGINRSGYKLLFNVERGGGQIIFHLHLHLIGGWK